MADSLWMRLRDVRWQDYRTSPSSQKHVSKMLESLASRKGARAMKASHDLWQALCAGQLYSAAEPCLPFLIEILGKSEVSVQGEILDLLCKFAEVPDDGSAEDWQKRLQMSLGENRELIKKISHSRDEIVADKARLLLEKMG